MLENKNIKVRKHGRKINSCYLIRSKSPQNFPKSTSFSSLNVNSLSIQDLISYSPRCKNRTKVMVTRLLSSSKNIMINKRKYNSPISFPRNFQHIYPYKPNKFFLSLNPPSRKRQNNILKISSPTTNNNESIKLLTSNFKKIRNKCHILKNKVHINKDKKISRLMSPMPNFGTIKRKIFPKKLFDESESEKETERKFNEGNCHITKENFMHFIDEMNKNRIHINKCKKYVKEYFIEKKDGNKSFFEDLLYRYKFEEHENDNYFSNNDYSSKKNSFNLKNFEVSFKITSLYFIFYEIPETKQNEQNFDSNAFYDIENKQNIDYIINSKIKLPFEFLSLFYGINFNEFINLMISIVEYDYDKNKFFIEQSNFINKIEIGKSLYDFFCENCYFILHNYKHKKECFIFDWAIKSKNSIDVKHFVVKILLPQIRINIKYNEYKVKFFSTIDIQTLGDLMKNHFKNWDLYIFIYFSEYKLFRYEINKILCGKYKTIFNDNIKNDFKNKTIRKKIYFNLNTINIILNTRIKNRRSYGFFYSHQKLTNIGNETYYIKLRIPRISISLNNSLYSFNKNFEISIKEMSQINRLRRSFRPEDIIKYSMTIIRNKKRENDILHEGIKPKRNYTSKISSRRISTAISKENNTTSKSPKIQAKKDGKRGFIKFYKNPNNEDYIKDIKLNLDNYIFNLDESILKFIKVKENKTNKIHNNLEESLNKNNNENGNNNKNNKDILNQNNIDIILRDNKDLNINNNKLEIQIGTIELSWTDQEALTKTTFLGKKQTEYLLDIPTFQWKFFVEKHIEKILLEEPRTLRPIRRESQKNFDWNGFITKKES